MPWQIRQIVLALKIKLQHYREKNVIAGEWALRGPQHYWKKKILAGERALRARGRRIYLFQNANCYGENRRYVDPRRALFVAHCMCVLLFVCQ
jgi:hypothetical protein